MTKWYDPKQAYIIMKLDCLIQRTEELGSCNLDEMHRFVQLYRTLPPKHQQRYGILLDIMAEYYDEEEQPCHE